ncbi:hypothetical protein Ade02nite_22510 [Paractinoplanes deccanensis]|uniref:Uncharacterized protein n=1 Tax=Paractinoplanes deccanensis TaxID=113561 RepID=A0ABQ3Y0W1_9ACTN|nr:hypothetical protein Ade02nite_22510 [Actinoplanes deccanensis]
MTQREEQHQRGELRTEVAHAEHAPAPRRETVEPDKFLGELREGVRIVHGVPSCEVFDCLQPTTGWVMKASQI